MDTCQHCGTVLPTGETGGRYCPNCGAPVEALAGVSAGGVGPGASQTHLTTPAEESPYEAFFRPAPGERSPHTMTQVLPAIPAQAQAQYADAPRPDQGPGGYPDQGPPDQGYPDQGYPEQPFRGHQQNAQPAYDQPIDYQAAPGRPYSEPFEDAYADDYDGRPVEPPRSSRSALIGVGVAAAAIVVIIVSLITLGGGKSTPAPQANTQPTQVLAPPPQKATATAPPETTAPPTSAPSTPANHVPGVLQLGDTGAEVKWLQNRLKQLSLYNGEASGNFDQATAAAVAAFQARAHSTDPAGVVGRSTKTALIAWGSKPKLSVFGGADFGGKKPHGTNPEDVKRLQRALSVALNQDVKASGNYDMATVGAVMQYEAAVGLAPDGATGDKVWAALQQGKLAH